MILVEILDADKKVVFRGNMLQASRVLGVSRGHLINLFKGYAKHLPQSANYPYLKNDNILYTKKPYEDKIKIGYKFNIKGYPLEITKIEKNSNGYLYTFNGFLTVQTRAKIDTFNTLWITVNRKLDGL